MYGIGKCSCQMYGIGMCSCQLMGFGVPNEIDLSITSLKQCGFIVLANYR